MDRTERLLARGYFPSQLPPSFTTVDLSLHHSALLTAWTAIQQKAPGCKPELFSVARAGHQRRVISLTNPVPQTFLATHIAQYWAQFVKHFRQSRLSASHPRFLASGSRAANIPSMQFLHERKVLMSAGYKFMLQADISRFFPTIYTHSVPWALHGKAAAKKNRQITPKYFGNLIDQDLRQGQDEQTMGLPIGPDTSHIIAEAIATSVDLMLKIRLKSCPMGFRYVDDYFLFFQTTAEAESALAALSRSFKEFELQLNFEKTKIFAVDDISGDYWTYRLRGFEIANSGKQQRADIHHFFELARDLARRNADENVMTYALKRASSVLIRKDNWDCFEAHVCNVALAYPNTLQTVAQLFATYGHHGHPVDKGRFERLLNVLIQDHAPLGHHSEVAWCLWMCKNLDVTLVEQSIDMVAEMHSSVCALQLLDLEESGKLIKQPRRTYWRQFEVQNALREDLWLLSYEAGVRGWAGFSDAHVLADKYFSQLHALGVRFYDTNASISFLFEVKKGALGALKLDSVTDLLERDDASDYLDYEEGDGGYEGVVAVDDEDEDDPNS